jgi:nucleotide-binding universal stress UspA family protein
MPGGLESGQVAVDFGIGLALRFEADVKVYHVRQLPKITRVPPLETTADAKVLVDEAVVRLRAAGVGADGRSRSARTEDVGVRIVEEASLWQCDAIVLGSVRR